MEMKIMNLINIPVNDDIESSAKKIAFTGSHGAGKTTSVFYYITQLKIKYPSKRIINLNENAAHCPLPINKGTTIESQQWIFCDQLSKEIDLTSKYDLLVCDRTICDSIAYSRATALSTNNSNLMDFSYTQLEFAKTFIHTYDIILFKKIGENNYWYDDGVRDISDLEYRQSVENELIWTYNQLIDSGINLNLIYI